MKMAIPCLYSIKRIEQQYNTGEEPVLVVCSDMNAYVCKYMRSSSAAYKLLCEFIGSQMAKAWQLETPDTSFVFIKQNHWSGHFLQHNLSSPALGSKRLERVVDITPSTFSEVEPSEKLLEQLLRIALFDFWIANEDRNANNANLLYDLGENRLVSIDYGCILNTATFEYPMSQLTSTDTILWSDLFHHVCSNTSKGLFIGIVDKLKRTYRDSLECSQYKVKEIMEELPNGWNVPSSLVEFKLQQLFVEEWTTSVWDNFMECLKENIDNERFQI